MKTPLAILTMLALALAGCTDENENAEEMADDAPLEADGEGGSSSVRGQVTVVEPDEASDEQATSDG